MIYDSCNSIIFCSSTHLHPILFFHVDHTNMVRRTKCLINHGSAFTESGACPPLWHNDPPIKTPLLISGAPFGKSVPYVQLFLIL